MAGGDSCEGFLLENLLKNFSSPPPLITPVETSPDSSPNLASQQPASKMNSILEKLTANAMANVKKENEQNPTFEAIKYEINSSDRNSPKCPGIVSISSSNFTNSISNTAQIPTVPRLKIIPSYNQERSTLSDLLTGKNQNPDNKNFTHQNRVSETSPTFCGFDRGSDENWAKKPTGSILSSFLTSGFPVPLPTIVSNVSTSDNSLENFSAKFLKNVNNDDSSSDFSLLRTCDYCQQSFVTSEELVQHLKDVHAIVDSFSPSDNSNEQIKINDNHADEGHLAANRNDTNDYEAGSDFEMRDEKGFHNGRMKRKNEDNAEVGEDDDDANDNEDDCGSEEGGGSTNDSSRVSKWKVRKYCDVISSAKSTESISWVTEIWNNWIINHDSPDVATSDCDLENLFRARLKHSPILLAQFARQCKQADGKDYPLRTLYSIFSIIQMYLNNEKISINIFKDEKYSEFQRALHEKMKPISRTMTAKSSMKRGVITENLEKELWDRKVLSTADPTMLLRTVFFLVGKHFNLGSRQEHRNLRAGINSQIKVVGTDENERIEFTEDSLFGREFNNIQRPTIYKTEAWNCPVKIIKLYLSKLPRYAVAFYCKPKTDYYTANDWYYNQPIGVNTLSKIVESIARDAGWDTSVNWSGAYVCSICQRSFRFQCNLSYHMKFHFMDKPHKCNLCFKGFASKTQLWSHKREVHKTDVKSPSNQYTKVQSSDGKSLGFGNQGSAEVMPPNVVSTSLSNNVNNSSFPSEIRSSFSNPLNLSGKPSVNNQIVNSFGIPTITTNPAHQIASDIYACFKCSAKFSSAHQMITHLENHIMDLEKRLNLAIVANNGSTNRAIVMSSMAPPITRPTDKAPPLERSNVINITTLPPHIQVQHVQTQQNDTPPLLNGFAQLENQVSDLLAKIETADHVKEESVSDTFSVFSNNENSESVVSDGMTLLLCPVLCQCGPCDEVFSSESDLKDHVMSHSSPEDRSKCKNCEMDLVKNEDTFFLEASSKPKVTFDLKTTVEDIESCENSTHSGSDLIEVVKSEDHEILSFDAEDSGTPPAAPPAPLEFTFDSALPSMVPSNNRLNDIPTFDIDDFEGTNESENRFMCEKCDETFADRFRLARHRRKHSRDERPDPRTINGSKFMCTLCSIPFRNEDDLEVHKSWHANGEPLQCEFCCVILSSRLSLKRHVLHVHVVRKPHMCNSCNASFERSSHLSKHKREAHGL